MKPPVSHPPRASRHRPPRALLAGCAAAVLVALALAAPRAAADGDPASDVLITHTYFVPSDAGASARQEAQLAALLTTAARAGLHVRVAVIPNAYDLGSALGAWLKPQAYAEFLGYELQNSFRSALIVVMPDGLGLNWPGHAGVRLPGLAPAHGAGALVAQAQAGVRALAARSGTRLAAAAPQPASTGIPSVVPIIVGAWALALAAVAVVLRRRGAHRVRTAPRRARRAFAVNRLLVLESAALVLAVTAAVTLIILKTQASSPGSPAAAPNAPFVFPASSRSAPGFVLTDQHGQRVSLAAYRGRPVIVTFIDPFCRNLCPLAAHVLNEVDRELPRAKRVPIIAVSVDIYADTKADLHQDLGRWSLVPQWEWAVGAPPALARVWHDYAVGVQVATKRRAGIVEHIIAHEELAYVVDRRGFERALFFWPYTVAEVEHTLASLTAVRGASA
jgi:cytochrome oxidase Cu insertion factor (SCO1/SenC/PrrC family)